MEWLRLLGLPILGLLLVLMPLVLSEFRLNLLAKYLCFAFPAIGIVLIWGYGGILSLGQGIFFGLGSYMMAMFLKLESTTSDSSAQALSEFFGSSLPDFMVWNSVDALPWWWEPFHYFWFTLPAMIILPAFIAFVLAYLNFRKRVGGVYFSIITLALSAMMAIVIIGQQGVTGGINGITDFKTFFGISFEAEGVRTGLYFATVVLLLIALVAGRFIVGSRLGKILVAIRDREDRVRFSGYDPAMFKGFIFAVAAVLSSIGGALFTLQVGLASPSLVGIVPSIEMVIYAAVGGRLSLIGAVYGAILVGAGKTYFSGEFRRVLAVFHRRIVHARRHLPARRPGESAGQVEGQQERTRGSAEVSGLILSVEDLTVSFDGFKAVDGLNFYVEEEELRVVIGPNGAGKTTLLDMICGKTKPSGGSIRFKNRQLTSMIEYQITRAGVGRKFQNPSVYEDLTVLENLEISYPKKRNVFGSLFFRRAPEIVDKIESVARQIYLDEQLGTKAGLLSHGQKQWLEIGMLLMQDPELMLLDEPVAGMSAREREQTAELLKRIAKGRSMVVIEHDMAFVKMIAQKVTVLHQGKEARRRHDGTGAERRTRHRCLSWSLTFIQDKKRKKAEMRLFCSH